MDEPVPIHLGVAFGTLVGREHEQTYTLVLPGA
jgi:hypothetical protein